MQTPNKFKLAIFDMDGVLVDSQLYWVKSDKDRWTSLGVEYNPEIEKDILGLNLDDTLILIKKKYNPKFSIKKAREAHRGYAKVIYEEQSRLMLGVRQLLDELRSRKFKIAIASSSQKSWIRMVIKTHKLYNCFDYIISTQGTKLKGKPHPDIYNHVIRHFKLKAKEAVIFEDSTTGLKSGKLSKASVIAIPDKRWSHGDFSSADLIAKSLADKKVYKFLGLK